jgi:glycerophosphoryl diester phosphodiesterase
MRNRALSAIAGAAIAVILTAPAAHADVLDQIVVAHRGATTSTIAEGTMASYRYAVANHADYLDGDIRWTKDSSDADTVGTMIISHDSTLDRVTNCSGYVSSWYWSSIYDRCRTDVGGQRLIKLIDLLKYGNSVGKSFALQVKLNSITDAQARQLWNAVKYSKVQLEASAGQLPALNKVKKLDTADPYHRIDYALVTPGTDGWPSISTVKATGTYLHARLEIPADVMTNYKRAGIRVFLYTGKNENDYARMAARDPYGVVVDDAGRFERWRATQT